MFLNIFDPAMPYDRAGRMRNNSLVGAYAYGNTTFAVHAPTTVTPSGGGAQTLAYDPNGNMTTGLDGKVMTYDLENRPLSVAFAGKKTCYVYGADGTRRKKIENFSPTQGCDAPTASQPVTLYIGQTEIWNWGQGNAEEILLYPTLAIRISLTKNAGGAVVTKVSTLHRDALGSVRAVTSAAGLKAERSLFRPFGEEASTRFDLATAVETKGFIGQRMDADAGLQYLNARYYDPKLGMFIQPDWWEVTKAGVGTNRYSYSASDPVNRIDPGGNGYIRELISRIFGSGLSGTARKAGERALETGMTKLRREGIDAAWRQEQALVRVGGGTVGWSKTQREELLRTGRVSGYRGHHINNVAALPEQAGLANNIEFKTVKGHTDLHSSNGGFGQPTKGPHIDRGKQYRDLTGKDLPAKTREKYTYKEVLDSAVSTVDKVLNSHTMRSLDLFDPTTYYIEIMRSNGFDLFQPLDDYLDPNAWMDRCAANPNCV